MSDFDKEAEREKLREKYEKDQKEREVAEKMSELLLQGATMTNAHCSDCGDPIFRYDGQEFCATCEKAVDRGGSDADADDDSEESEADADEQNIEVTSPSEDARVQFGANGEGDGDSSEAAADGAVEATDSESEADAQSADEPSPEPQTPAEPRSQPPASQSQPSTDDGAPTRTSEPAQTGQPKPTRETPSVEAPSADVTDARASLVRTLQRFSRQAEATEDPQRAREYLAAAREAAETLAALRQ